MKPALTTVILLATVTSAAAQEGANGIDLRFGIGPSVSPGYFGDEDLDPGVGVKFQLERFALGPFSFGGADEPGLGFGGSFRYIAPREAGDFSELAGLADIDPSLEIGGGVEYNGPDYVVFANLRYGAVGHESFVAELGADYEIAPRDALTVTIGPRVLVGDDDYAQTYFGVSDVESAASAFDSFDAEGGLISAGAKAEVIYSLNDDWEIVGTIEYERFLRDAADSPITSTDDQIDAQVVLTRRITLGF
ncbi:MAG: MipA/OmpV family protein [Pseudomonadota bacterium]